MNVKEGDQYPITLTVNTNLTGATTRLLVRHLSRTGTLEELAHTVTDAVAGEFEHTLDGTWAQGPHYLELELTRSGEVRTAPTDGVLIIYVAPDLD